MSSSPDTTFTTLAPVAPTLAHDPSTIPANTLPANTVPVATASVTTTTTIASASTTTPLAATTTTAVPRPSTVVALTTLAATVAATPLAMPAQDEAVEVFNTWGARLVVLNEQPDVAEVASICVARSACAARYEPEIKQAVQAKGTVEDARPMSVKQVRSLTDAGKGSFVMSVWTEPIVGGKFVTPSKTVARPDVPAGVGVTVTFVSYPTDTEFPWRATDVVFDA